jgi:hypothetical protein
VFSGKPSYEIQVRKTNAKTSPRSSGANKKGATGWPRLFYRNFTLYI